MLKVFGSEIRNQEKFLANSLEFPIVQTYNSIYRQKSHMTLTFDDQNIQIPKIFLNILTWFFDVNFFIIFPKYTEFLRTTLISKATLYWVTVSFCTWRWVMKKCQYKLLIIAVLCVPQGLGVEPTLRAEREEQSVGPKRSQTPVCGSIQLVENCASWEHRSAAAAAMLSEFTTTPQHNKKTRDRGVV